MRNINVKKVSCGRVYIGFEGEKNRTQVIFDFSDVFGEYPNATAWMTVKPPEGNLYPKVVTRSGNSVIWNISASDCAHDGDGEYQITFEQEDTIVKSFIGQYHVNNSLIANGTMPEPVEDWIETASEELAALQNISASAEQVSYDTPASAEITVVDGHKNIAISVPQGVPGTPGFSPIATVSKTGKKTTISITDAEGTTTSEVDDGKDGIDGFSPVIAVSTITGGHRITITDAEGTSTVDVMDGEKGDTGNGIASAVLNQDYTLTLAFTNGTTYTTPSIRGAKGAQGDPGRGISSVTLNQNYTLTITYTDGTSTTTGSIRGEKGATGETPVISIGTVETLSPGSSATATMDTTDPEHPVLSMGIPEGEPGDATIDDTSTANNRVWSAEKVNSLKSAFDSDLFDATHDRWHEENVPYIMRKSGGAVPVYDWERDTLIGGTVAWNQLFNPSQTIYFSGLTITTPKAGTWRFNGTISSAVSGNISNPPMLANHVYMMRNGRTDTNAVLSNTQTWNTSRSEYVFKVGETNKNANIYIKAGTYTDYDFTPQIIDLTAMFGSTIADYIYTLETGTAGAGVAWLKAHGFMTAPYYAYNAGELMSVKASAHKTVGKNLCESKVVSSNTSKFSGVLHAEINMLEPNTYYTFSFVGTVGNNLYANENLFDFSTLTVVSGRTVKTLKTKASISKDNISQYSPNNGWVIFKNNADQSSANVFDDLQIEFGSTATDYEPFVQHTYPLDSDLDLRGIPKLSNGHLVYDGDVYKADGSVKRKYGIVDLGTLTWSKVSDYFVVANSDLPSNFGFQSYAFSAIGNIRCGKYPTIAWNVWTTSDKVVALNDTYFGIKDSTYSSETPANFKTAMSGVYLVYELATPTTESADPFTDPQAVNAYGTEEYIDSRSVQIPVGHETKYVMTAYEYTEELTEASRQLMELIVTANREDSMKATKAYSSGNLLIVNGTLYKATTSIANGATLTVGTNVTATTVANELALLA